MIDAELSRALKLWSDVSDLEFEHVKADDDFIELSILFPRGLNTDVDISIRFETGFHGDSEPFDGAGLILGK